MTHSTQEIDARCRAKEARCHDAQPNQRLSVRAPKPSSQHLTSSVLELLRPRCGETGKSEKSGRKECRRASGERRDTTCSRQTKLRSPDQHAYSWASPDVSEANLRPDSPERCNSCVFVLFVKCNCASHLVHYRLCLGA